MSFYQYRKFHCGDKTVVRSSISTMGFPTPSPALVAWLKSYTISTISGWNTGVLRRQAVSRNNSLDNVGDVSQRVKCKKQNHMTPLYFMHGLARWHFSQYHQLPAPSAAPDDATWYDIWRETYMEFNWNQTLSWVTFYLSGIPQIQHKYLFSVLMI